MTVARRYDVTVLTNLTMTNNHKIWGKDWLDKRFLICKKLLCSLLHCYAHSKKVLSRQFVRFPGAHTHTSATSRAMTSQFNTSWIIVVYHGAVDIPTRRVTALSSAWRLTRWTLTDQQEIGRLSQSRWCFVQPTVYLGRPQVSNSICVIPLALSHKYVTAERTAMVSWTWVLKWCFN